MNKIDLSVIVPAYKAEKFIVKSLENIIDVLDQSGYSYEIICVVDGSPDKTYSLALKLSKKHPSKLKVTRYKNNLGKGYAVRYGMAHAKGEIVGFVDAGLEININGIRMMLEHFKWYDADVIIGSKRHPASKIVYPWQRKILSWGYQLVVRVLFGLKVKDTQVGMKFFKRKVLEDTLPRLLVKKFAFDIEMLSVANYLGYKRIFEAPVDLKMKFKGGVSTIASKGFLKTVGNMLWDTAAVYYRLRILHYYDSSNKGNWITPKYLTFSKE